jgi:hypothetical protein
MQDPALMAMVKSAQHHHHPTLNISRHE